MIHAFVQRLGCGEHLIVRAGPLATEHKRPYKKSCLGEIDGDAVTLMAFCEPWWIQFLRRFFPRLIGTLAPYVRASIRALMADGFKNIHLDRLGANPRHLVFTQGEIEGKITMKPLHEKLAEQSGVKVSHGNGLAVNESRIIAVPNGATGALISRAYADAIESGSMKMEGGLVETYLGGGRFLRQFIMDETPGK